MHIRDDLNKLIEQDLKFPVIYLDMPWTFKTYSSKGDAKSPSKHYDTMSIEELAELPIKEVAAKDSVYISWVYQPLLPAALELMEAHGFEYKTILNVWVKKTKHDKYHMSTGYYSRAGMEMCILGRRGNPPRVKSRGVRQVFEAKVREHSQKPDEMYDIIESLYDGPYLELFARNNPRPNWTKLGYEVGKL